ncbi:putative polyketide synthase [Fusarium austroafricanum]|uniref:Putative polyketide synthase n=1 Tax=Fusarium austroafricanum TaxID=2364996 RepID=A0A8H4NQ23_9HYPO|nr:putative polyketide synthase [Fusarium austroafricanum]
MNGNGTNGHSTSAHHNGNGKANGAHKASVDANMPIAITGISTRFPGGADTPESLWKMISKGKSAWSKIPEDRFTLESFHHPDPDRNGAMNVIGGHFLDEDIACFDAPFFGISRNEAKAMDPQQRLQLESAYEALENAGISIEQASGTKTSVYIGVFNKDYADIMCRDPETGPLYQATGNGQSILSNRISYFFNLKGPSVTVDTACSSSLVGLHLAVQGLRMGEVEQAIVGGTNLIFSPDIMVAMSLLGFLSPDGRSYAFDHRAKGYARGEGIATIVLKPLDKAIRDGDPIRAVIRGTGVNSDGRTAGITLPNGDAQEALIREVYANAGLDPAETGYFEAHGTGTQAGDPMEAGAIHRVFTADCHRSSPLLLGSIKTNIGHLEGASGLAGVVKAVLCLEKGQIPPNMNFEKPNERLDLEAWNIKVPTELTQWPADVPRRASVNSFGYGGTNAHVILDGYDASPHEPKNIDDSEVIRRIFVFSAGHQEAASSLFNRMASYLGDIPIERRTRVLQQLAYTLSERRSQLSHRLAVSAGSVDELLNTFENGKLSLVKSQRVTRLGLVFTGQGAQTAQMGVELMTYGIFAHSLYRASRTLKNIGCTWDLVSELHRDAETSLVNEPLYSQPLCTAVQIALVDLIRSWGVTPTAVTGHSSGEIAAAYAAGALTHEAAMIAAYYRGVASSQLAADSSVNGSMAAVGLSPEEAEEYLAKLTTGKLAISCYNAPTNVTISGDVSALEELEALLQDTGVFFRRLKVPVAYHSHHMQKIADVYRKSLETLPKSSSVDGGVQFYSSVTGTLTPISELDAEYWVRNMTSPVQFNSSLKSMCLGLKPNGKRLIRGNKMNVQMLVEVGPHSALAGPIKSILKDSAFNGKAKLPYTSCLVRREDAVTSIQKAAGELFMNGYSVNIARINEPIDGPCPRVLPDLPPYPWNHSQRYWQESRFSKNYRMRSQPRKDLIGAPVADWNPTEPRWRGFIRLSELPWIKDHKVEGKILYPAAGMISMAVEAMRQLVNAGQVTEFELRDIQIGKAIMISEEDGDLETMFTARPWSTSAVESSKHWWEFRLFAVSETEGWSEHCRGCISAVKPHTSGELGGTKEAKLSVEASHRLITHHDQVCGDGVNTRRMYDDLEHVGLYYGPSFQNISNLRSAKKQPLVYANVTVPDTAHLMPHKFEYPHLLHPVTLDSVLQTIFPALASGDKDLSSPLVPTFIKRMTVANRFCSSPGQVLKVASSAIWKGFRHADADITALDGSDEAMVKIQGLRCSSIAHMVAAETSADNRKLCFDLVWDDDLSLLEAKNINKVLPPTTATDEISAEIRDMETAAFLYMKDAIAALNPKEREEMSPHHRLFYDQMVGVCQRAEKKDFALQSASWDNCSDSERQELAKKVASFSAEGEMICRMGQNLVPILRQEADPLTLMLENDLLYDLYRTALGTDRCYEQMSKVIQKLSHKQPDLKILEIGAGTGGATKPILETLGGHEPGSYPRFVQYDFTDISSGFFEKAQENFKAWAPFINFKRLDVEGDLQDQGFAFGSYDVIIAANVLHATGTMKKTMQNVRKLLKPGGKLILMEVTHLLLRGSVIFGNLPGWWLGAGEGRTHGPTLTEESWSELLSDTGFSGLDICLRDFPDPEECMYSVIVTTAEREKSTYPPAVILDSFGCDTVATKQLAQGLLNLTGIQPEICSLDEYASAGVSDKVCVCLDEVTHPVIHQINEEKFQKVRNIVSSSKALLWVSRNGKAPEANLMTGLARSVRSEDQTKRLVTLDLDDQTTQMPSEAAITILHVFESLFRREDDISKNDWEFRERDGRLMVSRVIEDVSANQYIAHETQEPVPVLQPFHQPGRPLKPEIGIPGLLDTLRFKDDVTFQTPIAPNEVDIRVAASGVNFRDIMVAMGQLVDNFLGCECSGVVTQVGSNITHIQPGDRVCTWTLGSYSTFVRNPGALVQKISDDMSFVVAASIPIIYCTAYLAIIQSARLEKGESILIHAAAGGVGQAAIMLAKMIGAEIFVTVGTPDKRKFLIENYGVPDDHIFSSRDSSFADGIRRMTNGKGVDVVLNSLASELLRETWHCIAMFGRFIEIGKRDIEINTKLDMDPFIRNVTFASVDLTVIFRHRQPLGAAALKAIMDLLREKKIHEISPITTYPISQMEDAFRVMQAGKHLGKLIITAGDDDLVRVLPKKEDTLQLPADASYLLVGGLGGLGRATSAWLAEHGAKNLIFVSRSGTAKPEAAALVERLEKNGVNVAVLKCDVSDYEKLSAGVHDALKTMPPIRGLIHGGMVLNDSIFEAMTYSQYQDAIRPKVTGTINLHNLTKDMPLDFFIMLSSAAGVVGNSSQANYAAGGAFQDAFAHYRTALGLPAVTLDLGGIDDVGFVAENADYVVNLERWGYLTISQAEFFSMIKQAILQPKRSQTACQVVTGLGTQGMAEEGSDASPDELPFWFRDAKFSHLLQMGRKQVQATDSENGLRLIEAIPAAESLSEATNILCDAIIEKMAKMLGMPAESIDASQSMAAYGLDSLVAVELRNWLFREAKADVAVFEVLGKGSLIALAGDIALKSKILPAALRKEGIDGDA